MLLLKARCAPPTSALGSFASASLISILGAGMAGSALHFGFHAMARWRWASASSAPAAWSPPA